MGINRTLAEIFKTRKEKEMECYMNCSSCMDCCNFCGYCEYRLLRNLLSKKVSLRNILNYAKEEEFTFFHRHLCPICGDRFPVHHYIIVYLSDYIKTENGYDLCLDFYLPSDLIRFFRVFNLELPNIQGERENIRLGTFFKILSYTNDGAQIKLQRGTHYFLNVGQLKENSELIENDSRWNNNSQYFAQLKMKGGTPYNLFRRAGNLHYPLEIFTALQNNDLSIVKPNSKNIDLIVNNVGQGNWNQINVDDKPYIMYDMGMTCITNKTWSSNVLSKHLKSFLDDIPLLVISHWHEDHYNILLEMNDFQKNKFKKVICPSLIVNLSALNIISYFWLNPHTQLYITKYSVSKPYTISINKDIDLYIHKFTFNMNNGGNILVVKGHNSNVILTGDSYYSNLKNIIRNSVLNLAKTYLVVPHHGGYAGRSMYPANGFKCPEAIISVGSNNSYKHPSLSVINKLSKIFTKVSRTDICQSDIIRKL